MDGRMDGYEFAKPFRRNPEAFIERCKNKQKFFG